MLTKNPSPRSRYARYLMALPVLLLFITAFMYKDSVAQLDRVPVTKLFEPAPERRVLPASVKPFSLQDTTVYKIVHEMPRFPMQDCADKEEPKACSERSLFAFISDNLRYPKAAAESGARGMAVIRFVVEKDGAISNGQILRDPGAGMGDAALRVIESMPNWTPGKQAGKPVRVQFNVPIRFEPTDQRAAAAPEPKCATKYTVDGKSATSAEVDALVNGSIASAKVERTKGDCKTVHIRLNGKRFAQAGKPLTFDELPPESKARTKVRYTIDADGNKQEILLLKEGHTLPEMPLIVVDGVVSDADNLDQFSGADIISVNVIKGTEAFERFGERAKNGVISITTVAGVETSPIEINPASKPPASDSLTDIDGLLLSMKLAEGQQASYYLNDQPIENNAATRKMLEELAAKTPLQTIVMTRQVSNAQTGVTTEVKTVRIVALEEQDVPAKIRTSPRVINPNEELLVSPNPANSTIRVQQLNFPLGAATVSVLDAAGKTVHSQRIAQRPGEALDLEIDVAAYAPGTYYVRVDAPNQVRVVPFVKQ